MPAEVWATFPLAAQAVIVALAQRVRVLEAQVQTLTVRLGQNSTNSSRPPSSDPPSTPRRPAAGPRGRRPGGQPGHVGQFRALAPPERVDAVVDHWPTQCTGCAVALSRDGSGGGGGADYVPHQVTDLPVVRATVTEHRLHRVACATCGATNRATLPPEVPTGAFGPRLQATVALLSGRYRLSRREVADVCGTLLDAPVCVGSVDRLCQATSDAVAGPVAQVPATLPVAPVANADETSWRQAGQVRWLWTVVGVEDYLCKIER